MNRPSISANTLSSGEWSALEVIIAQFESAWQRGPRPDLADFLHTKQVPRRVLLAELIHVDLELRLKAGEDVRVESYLEGYPELLAEQAMVFELVQAEYLRRSQSDPCVTKEEYLQRFPQFADRLAGIKPVPREAWPATDVVDPDAASPATETRCPGGAWPGTHTGGGWRVAADGGRRHDSPVATLHPPPDLRVPGYEVLSVLGRGGMGVVYKARQLRLNRVVALKMILAGSQADSEEIIRFLGEAEAVAALQHPNVVQVFEVGQHNGLPFMALEFVCGGSLNTRLKQGLPRPAEAAHIVACLARGIQAAHANGIVHRDLKPHNVLLALKTENKATPPASDVGFRFSDFQPKVTDFGLAKKVTAGEGMTRTGALLGTPSYMAPEQAEGLGKHVGPAADVYALGAILYECLTGRPPFVGPTPLDIVLLVVQADPVAVRELQPGVPRDLETICLKCLQKEIGKRYGSAKDLADDLERFLHDEPILARPPSRVERAVKWSRRNKPWAILIGVVLLAVVGLAWLAVAMLLARNAESVQRLQAEKQRQQAYGNLEVAVNVIHQALLETGEKNLADRPGMQETRRELLQRAFPALERLIASYQDDPLLRSRLALAHHRVGELLDLTGESSKALDHYEEAIRLRRELVDEDARAPQRRGELALTLRARGNTYRLMKNREADALASLEESRGICADLAREAPNEGDWFYTWSGVLADLALVLKTLPGRNHEALSCLKEAVEVLAPFEKSAECLPHLARASSEWAGLLTDNGQKAKALEVYGKAAGYRRRLFDSRPESATYRADLAATCNDAGLLIHQIGKPEEARTYYQEALEHRRELDRTNPQVPRYAHLHALTANNFGLLNLIWAGKARDAERNFQEAQDVRENLVKRQPLALYRNSLGHVYQNQAQLQRQAGKLAAAQALLDRVLALRDEVLLEGRQNTIYRKHRAWTLSMRGELYLEKGRLKEAESDLDAALADRRDLADKSPGRKEFQDDLVLSHLAIGACQREMNRLSDAQRSFQSAVALACLLETDCPEYARHHAEALNELAQVQAMQGQPKEALGNLLKAVMLGERICAQQPGLWEHQNALGRSLYLAGACQRQVGDLDAARAALERARTVQQELRSLSPEQPAFTSNLALTLDEFGSCYPGGSEEGRQRFQQAEELHQAAATAAPEVVRFRTRLVEHQKLVQRYSAKTTLVHPKMSFEEARKPYLNNKYVYSGHVGPDGKVRNDGLGCSAFTSVVLHRMRDGSEWLERYDLNVHQWYGDKAAEHFGLKKVDTFAASDLLDADRTRTFVKDAKLKVGQLYLFNARKDKQGHVGFVRMAPDGALEQWHYSSIPGGLYTGDFRSWLKASLYRSATVELYLIPELK
jgi:serine/threonine protein kinase